VDKNLTEFVLNICRIPNACLIYSNSCFCGKTFQCWEEIEEFQRTYNVWRETKEAVHSEHEL